jgi:hypothetical protein
MRCFRNAQKAILQFLAIPSPARFQRLGRCRGVAETEGTAQKARHYKTAKQQNSKTAKQQNSKTAKQQNSKTAKQQNSKTTKQQNSKTNQRKNTKSNTLHTEKKP